VIEGIRRIQDMMERQSYVTDRAIATTTFLASELRKPVLIEGQAGVGKTEIAKVLATALDTELIRLQCYEGLDVNTALYEWNYPKQMLRIKMEEGRDISVEDQETHIFSDDFLLKRPLLRAISAKDKSPVLLIDEVDRADEEFEAFLLEVLSDFQVSVPELGTLVAKHKPFVILTSNNTRELSEALKRRCLYLFIDYPTLQKLRNTEMRKSPSISETLDWANALVALNAKSLDKQTLEDTLSVLVKHEADLQKAKRQFIAPPPSRGKPDDFGRFSGN
jgi:MoxR-like ATPase